MSKDSRFWRNVTLIALAHVAVIAGLIRWSVEARSSSNAQSIVWLGDVGGAGAAAEPTTGESPRPARFSPPPEPKLLSPDEPEKNEPLVAAAKSEIELPTPKPTATSTPTPKPAKNAPAKEGSSSQISPGKTGSAGKDGHAGGGNSTSEFGWYGNMLHDRFYSAWIQPTTNVVSGTKISTLVKVRIEKDGSVSNFEIIKPSENLVVNESVAAIAKRVTQVDPPPAGLGNGDHYDVKINFELNANQPTAQ